MSLQGDIIPPKGFRIQRSSVSFDVVSFKSIDQVRGSIRRTKSMPAIPQSWALDDEGRQVSAEDFNASARFGSKQQYLGTLDNIGSLGHKCGGRCEHKRCYWARSSQGCHKGWLCSHCHYCVPPPKTPEDLHKEELFRQKRITEMKARAARKKIAKCSARSKETVPCLAGLAQDVAAAIRPLSSLQKPPLHNSHVDSRCFSREYSGPRCGVSSVHQLPSYCAPQTMSTCVPKNDVPRSVLFHQSEVCFFSPPASPFCPPLGRMHLTCSGAAM